MTQSILVLSPTPTWPLDFGNRRRIFETCSWFKRNGYRVTFLHYMSEHDWRSSVPPGSMEAMQAQWDQVHHIPPQRIPHCGPAGSHHGIDEWWDPAIESHLRWLFATQRFDILMVNYTWLSRALTLAPEHTFRILDTHDKFSGRKEMLLREGLEPEFFYTTEEGEREALARADLVWAIKKGEEEQFSRMTSLAVRHLTVPHAMDLPVEADVAAIRDRIDRIPERGLRVGCLGGRNTINAVNFRRFIEAAGRAITRDLAPVEIVVAGSICERLEDIRKPYVRFMGYLDDLSEFYDHCDVVVCPLTFSTGLKIKVAEALGLGKPVIAHRHSFEGFTPFHPMQTMDSLEEIAEACVSLAFQPSLLYGLTAAAVRSAKVTQEEFRDALQASAAMARDAVPSVLVTLPDLQGATPQAVAHIDELLDNLRHVARVTLHYDGRCDRKVLTQLKGWSSFVAVCIGPDVRDRWAGQGHPADLNGLTVTGPEGAAAAAGARVLWIAGGRAGALRTLMADHPGLLAFGDVGSYRRDPLRAEDGPDAADAPLPVAFAVRPFAWIAAAGACHFAARRSVSIPFGAPAKGTGLPERTGGARRLVIAATRWSLPLAKALGQVLTGATPGLDVLVITDGDAAGPAIPKVTVASHGALTFDTVAGDDARVAGCVFLGEDAYFAFDLLEGLVRDGCPVITAPGGRISRDVLTYPPQRHQENSLIQLVAACQDLFGETDEAKANAARHGISPEMFSRGSGWAFVWRQIREAGRQGV